MALTDELGTPPPDPHAFQRAWAEFIRECRRDGRADPRTPLLAYRPEMLAVLAQAPSEGLYVKQVTEAVEGHQANVSRALKAWAVYGLVDPRRETESQRDLGRTRRTYYRLTRRGRALAALLEDT